MNVKRVTRIRADQSGYETFAWIMRDGRGHCLVFIRCVSAQNNVPSDAMKPQHTIPISLTCAGLILSIAWFAGSQSVDILGIPGIFLLGLCALCLNWLAFIPAVVLRTETFYDGVGTCTYLMMVGFGLYWVWPGVMEWDRRVILGTLVAIWAIRLGVFLVRRVHSVGKDGRFDKIKYNTWQFFMSWSIQALWAFLVSLPVLIMITKSGPQPELQALDIVGWSLWAKGFLIEIVADHQKERFRHRADSDQTWIDEGLWSHAQHPNYFGEILLWTGICLSGVHCYEGAEWLALLSPVFVYLILTQVSGIPMVRERCEEKWGDDPGYWAYRRRTHVLIPWPWPRSSSTHHD